MKGKVRRGLGVLLCAIIMCSGFTVQAAKKQSNLDWHNSMEELVEFQARVNTTYSFSVNDADNVAISNRELTDTGVVYMEYEVGKVTMDESYQMGLLIADGASNKNLMENGHSQMQYANFEKGQGSPMLVEGAKYFICFAKRDGEFETYVQRVYKGEISKVRFPHVIGEWDDSYEYFTLFFGEGWSSISAEFKNFKCYDTTGKNLGIQLNSDHVKVDIVSDGEVDDLEYCLATYYCKENPELGMIVLQDDTNGYHETSAGKENFTYKIVQEDEELVTLYLLYPEGKEVYDYKYVMLADDDGNRYTRLRDVKAAFVTDEETIVKEVTAKNGYRVEEPEAPKKSGAEFAGWYLGNDEAYDFDSVATESITLYAKWSGEDGQEYISTGQAVKKNIDYSLIITLAGSVLISAGCIAGSILILKKGKNGKREERKIK